jgi:predicted phage-related endonuclease
VNQASAIERRTIVSRAEWLAWRLQDVTASDIAPLFGLDPYGRSALSVWAEKVGLTLGIEDNPTLRRGRWGEAAVIEMLGEERPSWEIRRAKVYLRYPAIRLGATPDAFAHDPERPGPGVVQCKTVAERAFERHWIDGAPPLHNQIQTLTEMMLAGASWGIIAALVMDAYGGWEPVLYEMGRNEAAEAKIRARAVRFWTDLEAGLMPAIDPARDAETVAALYPRALSPEPVDLTGDNLLPARLAKREGLKGEVKAALAQIEGIETELKAKLGAHQAARVSGWKVTWKSEHHKEYVVPASERRVLRIKELT